MVKLKALASFSGREGFISRGSEFETADEQRAGELERRGLAERSEASERVQNKQASPERTQDVQAESSEDKPKRGRPPKKRSTKSDDDG